MMVAISIVDIAGILPVILTISISGSSSSKKLFSEL